MELKAVSGFGSFPDGRLRAGPFAVTTERLSQLMRIFRIYPGENILSGMISGVPGGIVLSAAGCGVTGYLVDHDGLEVSATDLDDFVIASVAAGSPFRISGHYCPEPDVMISSHAVAVHDGRRAVWHRMRRLRSRDGSERVIDASRPVIAPVMALAV